MMKKMWSVFQRDLKISMKDPLAFWMILAPVLIAVVILWISPGISELTMHFAVDETVGQPLIDTLSDYADIEVLTGTDAVQERVLRRDEVIGLIAGDDGPVIVKQGNETETTVSMAQLLVAMTQMDTEESAQGSVDFGFLSFRDETSPLKRTFSITLLLMIGVITAMLIALGLVDEKNDQTIRAANVTPMPQTLYVLSKSLIGVASLLITSVGTLFVLGITDINWVQILVMIVVNAQISIIVAFVIGLSSSDFIEATGSVKMLMLPLFASVLVYELTDPVWHITVMWSPFYWAYRGITEIIQGTADWGGVLLYSGIILVISSVVFLLCKKRIRTLLA